MLHYRGIGILGFLLLFLLAWFIVWRWILFSIEFPYSSELPLSRRMTIYRKHIFFFFLLFATICDMPMYVGFIVLQRYALIPYSFHKLEASAFLAAYSITIGNWCSVLFEIQEDRLTPFLLRRAALYSINLICGVISVVNFAYCYTSSSMTSFLSSIVYEISTFATIVAPLVLTVIMLHAGLRLSWRIQGAAGTASSSAIAAKEASQREKTVSTGGRSISDVVPRMYPSRVSITGGGGALEKAFDVNSDTFSPSEKDSSAGTGTTDNKNQHHSASAHTTTTSGFSTPTFLATPIQDTTSNTIYNTIRTSVSSNSLFSQATPSTLPQQTKSKLLASSADVDSSAEFLAAVRRLNIVMMACACSITIQVTLDILNVSLGYSSSTDITVGPDYFYFFFTDLFPAWVLTLAQLYLSRKQTMKDDTGPRGSNPGGAFHYRPPGYSSSEGEEVEEVEVADDLESSRSSSYSTVDGPGTASIMSTADLSAVVDSSTSSGLGIIASVMNSGGGVGDGSRRLIVDGNRLRRVASPSEDSVDSDGVLSPLHSSQHSGQWASQQYTTPQKDPRSKADTQGRSISGGGGGEVGGGGGSGRGSGVEGEAGRNGGSTRRPKHWSPFLEDSPLRSSGGVVGQDWDDGDFQEFNDHDSLLGTSVLSDT